MSDKIRILILLANPWTCSRILVDEEAREIFMRLQEGPYREQFDVCLHTAVRPEDIQRLLMLYRPHIVHFCGHGHKSQRIFLNSGPGQGKTVDNGLARVFALYRHHLRLVVLNACFTDALARSITTAVDYSVGTGKAIGDKAGVAFAGAFYRALGFGNTVREAFASAKAELGLTRTPRAQGIELFVRHGINESEAFPSVSQKELMFSSMDFNSGSQLTFFETRLSQSICLPVRRRDEFERRIAPGFATSAR